MGLSLYERVRIVEEDGKHHFDCEDVEPFGADSVI
jgi:hypothetical protein